jgi:hypothetical protein
MDLEPTSDRILPKELLIEIFEKLFTTDLARCSEVCKYWFNCSFGIVGWVLLCVDEHPPQGVTPVFRLNIDMKRPTRHGQRDHFGM